MSIEFADYVWHCIYCPPQRELATGVELSRRGMPVVIPAEKDWRLNKRNRDEPFYRAVMPRYVFTGFKAQPNWEALRNEIPYVQAYMQFGPSGPTIIKHADIQWLDDYQNELRGHQRPKVVEEVISIGDKVKVLQGPFLGHTVHVDKIVSKRIHAIMDILGRPTWISAPLANVARV
jgi:transcription antitermination factor NusG